MSQGSHNFSLCHTRVKYYQLLPSNREGRITIQLLFGGRFKAVTEYFAIQKTGRKQDSLVRIVNHNDCALF